MDSLADLKFSCKCTWNFKEDIRHAISFGNLSEKSNGVDLNNLVKLETCVLLSKPENDIPCTLSIILEDPSTRIIKLSAASEARIIEVYGLYEEYITTVVAENLDDVEGMLVNLAEAEVTPLKEITLKLAGIKNTDSIWLFGVRLIVDHVFNPAREFSKVNYQNVDERLKTSKVPITEKAERCKKFLQQYTKITNSYAGKQPDPQTVLKLLEEDCMAQLKPLTIAGKNMSKCISSFMPTILAKKDGISGRNADEVCPNPEVADLKQYIDNNLQKLENRLVEYFDEKLRLLEMKQNEKLDSILTLLKER